MEKTIQIPFEYSDSIIDVCRFYKSAFSNENMKSGDGWIANAMGYILNDCVRAEKEQSDAIQIPSSRARYLLEATKAVIDMLGKGNANMTELRKYLCKQLNCIV